MNYSLHPEALGDLRDAASFYLEQAGTSLSQSFLGEFEQSIDRILRHPALGSPWRGQGRRRYLMKHFPYSLIYSLSSNEIRILAVAHHSRRPGYWVGRR
jgi:plasmid stabilization system protein ParE